MKTLLSASVIALTLLSSAADARETQTTTCKELMAAVDANNRDLMMKYYLSVTIDYIAMSGHKPEKEEGVALGIYCTNFPASHLHEAVEFMVLMAK